MWSDRKIVLVVTAAVSVAVAAFAAFCPLFATDALCRYAPMAEEFAAGNWAEAFHPRFGVGMPVVSGLVCRFFGLNGLSACAVVASFAWAWGLFPVWLIADRLFGRRAAWFALVLYAICPQPLLWGLKGLREPFKLLGTLLMVEALLSVRTGAWSAAVRAALGAVFLVSFKPDAILLCGILSVAFAVADRFAKRSVALLAVFVLALQPMCWLTWVWTGCWLPSVQYVGVFHKLMG